jgi:ribosomal protein L40E
MRCQQQKRLVTKKMFDTFTCMEINAAKEWNAWRCQTCAAAME